jgi:hypothetical protein
MSPWFYEDRMESEIKPMVDLESPPWDLWGLFLSTLCLVHCLLTPCHCFDFTKSGSKLAESRGSRS